MSAMAILRKAKIAPDDKASSKIYPVISLSGERSFCAVLDIIVCIWPYSHGSVMAAIMTGHVYIFSCRHDLCERALCFRVSGAELAFTANP